MGRTLVRFIFALSILLFGSSPHAADGWAVTDGDTMITPWGEKLRVGNVDTPEIGSKCKCRSECALGARATAFTRDAMARATQVSLTPYSEPGRRFKEQGMSGPLDQFKRSLVLVSLDGRDLGELLIAARLARPWEGKRRSWCSPS